MKRRIAGIVAMILLAGICLAGCSVEFKEEEFHSYDENGEVFDTFDDLPKPDGYLLNVPEGKYTYRKIGIGSTREEVVKAYGDVKQLIEEIENEAGRVRAYRIETDYGIITIWVDENDIVDAVWIMDKSNLPEELKEK